MIGRRGPVSHHLESVLDVVKLVVLCAFICTVGYSDAQIRKTLFYK